MKTVLPHTELLQSGALSPDGKLAVTVSRGMTIQVHVWNVESGLLLKSFHPVNWMSIPYIRFLNSNRILYFIKSKGHGKPFIWNWENDVETPLPDELLSEINWVDLSTDGKRLLLVKPKSALVLNLETMQVEKTLEFPVPFFESNSYSEGKFSPDGSEIAFWHYGYIIFFNSNGTYEIRPDKVYKVDYSNDGKRLVLIGTDSLELWDRDSLTPIHRLSGYENGTAADLSPDQTQFVGGLYEPRVWNIQSGTYFENETDESERYHYSYYYTPDGSHIVGLSNSIRSYRASGLQPEWEVNSAASNYDSHESPDRTKVAIRYDNYSEVYDLLTGKLLFHTPEKYLEYSERGRVSFLPDGNEILVFSPFQTSILNLDTGEKIRDIPGVISLIDSLKRLTPDGRYGLVNVNGDTLQVVDWSTGENVIKTTIPSQLRTYIFSSDGDVAYLGLVSGQILVMSMRNGAILETLDGHTNIIVGLRLFKDGKRLLSSSIDGTYRIWNLDSEGGIPQTNLSQWQLY